MTNNQPPIVERLDRLWRLSRFRPLRGSSPQAVSPVPASIGARESSDFDFSGERSFHGSKTEWGVAIVIAVIVGLAVLI